MLLTFLSPAWIAPDAADVLHDEPGLAGLGYQVSGGAVQAGVQRSFRLAGPVSLSAEAKVAASHSVLCLTQGSASVPLLGFQLLAGIQVDL